MYVGAKGPHVHMDRYGFGGSEGLWSTSELVAEQSKVSNCGYIHCAAAGETRQPSTAKTPMKAATKSLTANAVRSESASITHPREHLNGTDEDENLPAGFPRCKGKRRGVERLRSKVCLGASGGGVDEFRFEAGRAVPR